MSEAGHIQIFDKDSDRPVLEAKTHQCCHCGKHFVAPLKKILTSTLTKYEAQFVEQQGRTTRGWCMRCNGHVCGAGCAECQRVNE